MSCLLLLCRDLSIDRPDDHLKMTVSSCLLLELLIKPCGIACRMPFGTHPLESV